MSAADPDPLATLMRDSATFRAEVLTELRRARQTLDGLRHPTREPRNGRECREALSQSRQVAGEAVDRIDRALALPRQEVERERD